MYSVIIPPSSGYAPSPLERKAIKSIEQLSQKSPLMTLHPLILSEQKKSRSTIGSDVAFFHINKASKLHQIESAAFPSPLSQKSPNSENGGKTPKDAILTCTCELCNSPQECATSWCDAVSMVLHALTLLHGRRFFHIRNEIAPFMDTHWDRIWTREKHERWAKSINMAVSKYPKVFLSGNETLKCDSYWGLAKLPADFVPLSSSVVSRRNAKRKLECDNEKNPPKKIGRKSMGDTGKDPLALLAALACIIPLNMPNYMKNYCNSGPCHLYCLDDSVSPITLHSTVQ